MYVRPLTCERWTMAQRFGDTTEPLTCPKPSPHISSNVPYSTASAALEHDGHRNCEPAMAGPQGFFHQDPSNQFVYGLPDGLWCGAVPVLSCDGQLPLQCLFGRVRHQHCTVRASCQSQTTNKPSQSAGFCWHHTEARVHGLPSWVLDFALPGMALHQLVSKQSPGLPRGY